MISSHRSSRALVLALIVLAVAAPAWGQDVEPNSTCQTAQAVDVASLPFVLNGNLEATPPTGDVDFYRITATPNQVIVATLEGQTTGQGTLQDPFLGLFDANCQLVRLNDDGAGNLNSRLGFAVPASGVFVLAVSSCCDDSFTESEPGTYRLSLAGGGSIAGSVRDGAGDPLVPAFLGAFTPDGAFAGRAEVECCAGDVSVYELFLSPGTYRVGAEALGARRWHQDRPSFQQATDVVIGANTRITGVDFTLSGRVRVTPVFNRFDYAAGDTMVLDLDVVNPSANPVSVLVAGTADVPGEPGIATDFLFRDRISMFPPTTLTVPPGRTVVESFASYRFTGGEQQGFYDGCVTFIQDGIADGRCAGFGFGAAFADPAARPRSTADADSGTGAKKKKP